MSRIGKFKTALHKNTPPQKNKPPGCLAIQTSSQDILRDVLLFIRDLHARPTCHFGRPDQTSSQDIPAMSGHLYRDLYTRPTCHLHLSKKPQLGK